MAQIVGPEILDAGHPARKAPFVSNMFFWAARLLLAAVAQDSRYPYGRRGSLREPWE